MDDRSVQGNGDVLAAALAWCAVGCSVVRVATDGTKRPVGTWKFAQSERASADTVRAWFQDGHPGLGIVCGAVSGGLEMLEIEGRAADVGARFLAALNDHGLADVKDRLVLGYAETSPSGGAHVFYRVAEPGRVAGNTKLAQRPTEDGPVPLIETRGEGGFVVVAPSHGPVHPTGRPWVRVTGSPGKLASLTADERDALHSVARMYDEMPPPEPIPDTVQIVPESGLPPGSDLNERGTWDEVLIPAGWSVVHRNGSRTFWRRPGKRLGVSAVTGGPAGDYLYVWSTSTSLPAEEGLSKWRAYSMLHHGGDWHAAARALGQLGYGTRARTNSHAERPALTVLSRPALPAVTLDQVHATFRRWLGAEYDLTVLDAVLCAAAAEQLPGDPVWLLVVSGSGAAKTETVTALAGAGATVTSTLSGEAALLSASGRRDRAADATGGLLRTLGGRGLLVIKDVTTILSMNRDARSAVLAALREVYDGRWERNVGTDGGRTLTWEGRLVVIGAVTTAWDHAHSVVASMGDRFVVVRLDSATGREASGHQAIANTGHEDAMRAELAAAVGGLLGTVRTDQDWTLTIDETETLLKVADIVTLSRTGVEHDYRGDVINAHAPEMPTRFAKQLTQLVRGALALGLPREWALAIAIRCGQDSIPPLRLSVLADILAHPYASVTDVRKRINKPRTTVDRTLQALHMLGLLSVEENDTFRGIVWRYSLTPAVDEAVLDRLCRTRNGDTPQNVKLFTSHISQHETLLFNRTYDSKYGTTVPEAANDDKPGTTLTPYIPLDKSGTTVPGVAE